jgi:LAGLIDADG endonuclease
MSHFDAYCAGFFDADGSICISRVARGQYSENHRLIIDLAQHIDRIDILQEFQRAYGGAVRVKRQNRASYTPLAQIANWHLQRREDVEEFLRAISPYLRCKRLQAEIALEFLAEAKTSDYIRVNGRLGGRSRLTPEQIAVREALRVRMRMANHLSTRRPLTLGLVEEIEQTDQEVI